MIPTIRPRVRALVVAIALVSSLLASGADATLAANTRYVYFGAPQDVCPIPATTTNPYPCGGGIDQNTGGAVQGIEIFSPTEVTTTTATGKLVGYRLEVANLSGSTLTHVVLLGGALAGLTTNPQFPPPTHTVGPSLPAGFTYVAVYVVSGPAPRCTIASDRLSCDFGNLAAGTTPSILLVVMRTPTTAGLPTDPWHPQPWNELQVKEGASSSGANVDSYYAVGQDYTGPGTGLTVTASLTSYVESFVAPPGGSLINVDSGIASPSAPAVTRIAVPARPNGDNDKIEITGSPTDSTPDCLVVGGTSYTCFGVLATVTVHTPINIVTESNDDQFGIVDPADSTKWLVPPLQIDFRWDASEIPGKVNVRNLQVFHDGALVSTFCTSVPPQPGQGLPCRTAAAQYKDKDLSLTVYSDRNGSWKPGY